MDRTLGLRTQLPGHEQREDPAPRIDEEWEVVAGAQRIEPDPLVDRPASARLFADCLVVEQPDGEQIPLPDVEIISECWGCYAG